MAETGGTYLPPVIASLVGEVGDLAKTLVEAKALLEDFSKAPTTAHLEIELTSLPELQADLFRDIGGVQALAEAHPIDVPMQLDMFKILSDTAAFRLFAERPVRVPIMPDVNWARLAADRELIGAALGTAVSGGFWRAILGALAGRAGAGIGAVGGAAGGIPRGLGFGTAGFGAGAFGLAGFGTAAGLAGFGLERVLTLVLGLVGSLSEAFMGLGVIAAGTFATIAVGMGSDMLVMKSTIADTQTLYKTLTQLEQAQYQYGAGSAQAAFYTQQLNTQMYMLGNTAGVQAELGLAKLAMTLNQQWDQASSAARVQAVGLLTQVVYLAQTYVPLVTEAARRNLSIINTALMPLFAWLKGPEGIGIFTDLENKFAKDLPTAMDTFNQGVIFFLRFLDLASNYTGGFIQWLDRLFTYLNSPAGWARVRRDVQQVIDVFQVWRAFIVILFKDLALLLGQSVGVGTTMISMLTGMLTRLHDYLESTSGKNAVGSLFQAHKAEIVAILQLLPKLVGPVAEIYLKLAVPLTQIATAMVNIVNALISIPGIGPILAYGIAFGILASKLQLAALWTWIWTGATKLATIAQSQLDIALDANVIAIIILAIAALIIIIVLLITHWKEVTKVVQSVWRDITKFVGQLVSEVGKFFSALGTIVEKGWSEFAKRPGYWIGYLVGFVLGKFVELSARLNAWFLAAVLAIVAWGASMAEKAPGAMTQLINAIINEAQKLPDQFLVIGAEIVIGLIQGIKNFIPWAESQISGFMTGLVQGARRAIRSGSPSQAFADIGATIPQGIGVGVNANAATALSALALLYSRMLASGQTLGRVGSFGAPASALAGGGSLRGPISISAPITVQVQGASAATPQGIGTAVQQAVAREFEGLVRQLQGGVYSNPGG